MQGDGADRSERVRLREVSIVQVLVHEPIQIEQPTLPEATLSQSSDENCSIFFTVTDFFWGGGKSKSALKILGNFFDLTDLAGGESTEV